MLITAGAIHGLGVIVGIASKGQTPLAFIWTVVFVLIGIFLLRSTKKNNQ